MPAGTDVLVNATSIGLYPDIHARPNLDYDTIKFFKDSGLRQKLDLILVAIKRADGEMLFNPTLETLILAGDTLIALGLRRNLEALEKLVR